MKAGRQTVRQKLEQSISRAEGEIEGYRRALSALDQAQASGIAAQTPEVSDKFQFADLALKDLTSRELEVLSMIGAGVKAKDIARTLNLSLNTVNAHRLNLYGKLGLHAALEIALYCVYCGLVKLPERPLNS